jgi:hypothetical protein
MMGSEPPRRLTGWLGKSVTEGLMPSSGRSGVLVADPEPDEHLEGTATEVDQR